MPNEFEIALDDSATDLLSTLTTRIRVLSLHQIARTWPIIIHRLSSLERSGLLFSFVAVAHPELRLERPVMRWERGDEWPDFSKASYALRSRWRLPGASTKCFIASRAAGRMFGGHGGRYPRESEETHDIHLSSIYLHYRAAFPSIADSWVSEARFKSERRQRRGRVPDAIVATNRVVEFGGAYKKAKLLAFHKYCEAQGFDYEVW